MLDMIPLPRGFGRVEFFPHPAEPDYTNATNFDHFDRLIHF
jgi:hypothetical protein